MRPPFDKLKSHPFEIPKITTEEQFRLDQVKALIFWPYNLNCNSKIADYQTFEYVMYKAVEATPMPYFDEHLFP